MKPIIEIEEQIDLANDAIQHGGIFFGMTYEDGVKNALQWVIEETDEKPMEE